MPFSSPAPSKLKISSYRVFYLPIFRRIESRSNFACPYLVDCIPWKQGCGCNWPESHKILLVWLCTIWNLKSMYRARFSSFNFWVNILAKFQALGSVVRFRHLSTPSPPPSRSPPLPLLPSNLWLSLLSLFRNDGGRIKREFVEPSRQPII